MRNRLLIVSVVSSILMFSCNGKKDVNAAGKVNKTNLEEAKKRDVSISENAIIAKLDKTEYNFGTVNEGDIVKTSFKITNEGKGDLIITNAQGSCGCTVPEWPKEAIKTGETAEIKIKFNTSGKPNKQVKTVTLYTNSANSIEVLKITGFVTPKAKV